MDYERQQHAPIYEALERFRKKRVVPFDVPGHKRGRGNPELVELLGEKCVSLDVKNNGLNFTIAIYKGPVSLKCDNTHIAIGRSIKE